MLVKINPVTAQVLVIGSFNAGPVNGSGTPATMSDLAFDSADMIDIGNDAPGRIVVGIEVQDDRLVFRVTDNGIGLPPEHRHRLTEPYVTTRVKGTGLGLAIVRKIMEDHGGEIALQDAGGEQHGAEVTLTFPLRQKVAKEKGLVDEQERIAANDG